MPDRKRSDIPALRSWPSSCEQTVFVVKSRSQARCRVFERRERGRFHNIF